MDIFLEIDEEMSRLYQARLAERKIADKMLEVPLVMEVEPVVKEFTRKFVPPLICYNDCCYNRKTAEDSNSGAFSVMTRNVFRRYVSLL